jgi:DUF1365 family protein
MSTASCLYEGAITHRRSDPPREFRHRIGLALIDLDELPHLLGGRLVSPRPGLVRFRRSDYLGDPATPLADAVRDEVERATGARPAGPVRVLTNLRSLGHCFNPVSFYYCMAGAEIEALVAEVTNTPWHERHAYVIPGASGRGLAKRLHVSPFMPMDQRYAVRTQAPGETLAVSIASSGEDGAPAFHAALSLRRTELTPASLRGFTLRHPGATLSVSALIYAHALRLWGRRVPVHAHPGAQVQ